MAMKLCLFGVPTLYEDGNPVRLGRRKAMALLSYLAVTRSRHHRETLATLLWPESDRGGTALRQSVRRVREPLRAGRGGRTLQPSQAIRVRGDRQAAGVGGYAGGAKIQWIDPDCRGRRFICEAGGGGGKLTRRAQRRAHS